MQHLLDWVVTYQECPDRQELEAEGDRFPPIYPGLDPDSDWLIFAGWLQGNPVRTKMKKQLRVRFFVQAPDFLTDEEIEG